MKGVSVTSPAASPTPAAGADPHPITTAAAAALNAALAARPGSPEAALGFAHVRECIERLRRIEWAWTDIIADAVEDELLVAPTAGRA